MSNGFLSSTGLKRLSTRSHSSRSVSTTAHGVFLTNSKLMSPMHHPPSFREMATTFCTRTRLVNLPVRMVWSTNATTIMVATPINIQTSLSKQHGAVIGAKAMSTGCPTTDLPGSSLVTYLSISPHQRKLQKKEDLRKNAPITG